MTAGLVLITILLGGVLIKAFAMLGRPRNDNVVSEAWLREHGYERKGQQD